MFKKASIAVVAGAAISLLVAGAAVADTGVVVDPTQDAIVLVGGSLAYGDYNIDLVSTTIDHHDDVLTVSSAFTYTDSASWNSMQVSIDSNADGLTDLALVWTKAYGYAKAFSTDTTGALVAPLCDLVTAETFGYGGTVSVSVPRSCIGSPASVRVHTDIYWAGYSSTYGNVYFLDSAPGQLIDTPTQFSAPVNVSFAVVVPSVTPPAVAPAPVVTPPVVVAPAPAATTKLTLKATSSTQKFGKKPVKVVVKVTAAGNPKGKIKLYDGKKVLKTATVHSGKATFTLSKKLKVGKHKLHAIFYPAESAKFVASTSKKINVTVKKVK